MKYRTSFPASNNETTSGQAEGSRYGKAFFLALTMLLLAALPVALQAQYLTGVMSFYNDSFVEWRFFTEDEEEEGVLKLTWQMREDDWTQWDYRIGDHFGDIKLKWRDQPDEWELRGNNKIVSARTLWRDDYREWRITSSDRTLTLKTKWGNLWDEWELRDSRHGRFIMYTTFERDPREWIIVDEMNEGIAFEIKMMMMFIVIFNSSPRQ